MTRRLVVVVAVCIALVGCTSGRNSNVSTHTGIATAADGAISVEADGWTYSIPLDVSWTGRDGWHDGDRPDCLPPGANVLVRFSAVEVTVEGTTWRPVVWVDCRGAGAQP